MEKPTCKLCFRSFANGRALGGHMRSHVAASAKAAAQLIKDSSISSPSHSSSSSRYEDDDVDADAKAMMMSGLGYGLRNNPKKSFRLVDPEFSSSTLPPAPVNAAAAGSSIVVQDHESETESSRPPTSVTHRRRSKRARRASAQPEPEPVSSVSDTTPEEDVAISLMMLSRDIWSKSEDDEAEQDEEQERQLQQMDVFEDTQLRRTQPVKGRSKYQCGACKKVFRSYQALGGHRASHKKANGCLPPNPKATQIHQGESIEANVVEKEKMRHECPVCYRVFSSGQALGGHKRSHLTNSTTTKMITVTSNAMVGPTIGSSAASGSRKYGESLIDLNLPAPLEDDAELSAVSDAEFVMVRSSN